jgi:hypothetical protein
MKRALIGTILGLAASVASSYGQATYLFDTYLPLAEPTGPSGQIMWGAVAPDSLAGTLSSSDQNLVANLLWQIGTASGIANTSPVQVDQYGLITDAYSPNAGVGTTEVSFAPGYAGAAITFTIQVWQTGVGITGFADAVYKGSETFTDPGITPGSGYSKFDPSTFPDASITVTGVPEPTTMALLGLGVAGLLIIRKRQ